MPFFSLQHLHLKEGDLEEKKSFPARSITLRGAAEAAFASYYGEDEVSDYDEEDEDEELYDWERHVPKNPHTGKAWGSVENDWCYNIQDRNACHFTYLCKWDTGSDACTPKLNSSSDYGEDEVSEELYDEEDEDEKFYYYENEEWCNSIHNKRMCNFSYECTWDWRYRKCNPRSLASSDYGED